MFGFRRWVLRPLIQRVTTQAEVWESRIFSRLTELDHKLTSVAEIVVRDLRWHTSVCVMWTELEPRKLRRRGWQELSKAEFMSSTPPEEEPLSTADDVAPVREPERMRPRCTSIGAWLAEGETRQIDVPTFQPIPAGAWLVSLGPALLRAVHVGNQVQDMGGAMTAGRICVLGDPLEMGQRLSVTLEQPGKGRADRS